MVVLLALLATFVVACGSTSITQTSAPDDPRCQISLSAQPSNVTAGGGSVSIGVSTTRDCTWTAKSEATWIRLSSGSGQGETTLTATVDPNPDITARSASVDVNSQKIAIAEDARPCTYSLSPPSVTIAGGGGSGHIAVTTINGCPWHATASDPWIHVPTDSRTGSGGVDFTVDANGTGARGGVITIADQQFTVSQNGLSGPPAPPVPPFPSPGPTPDCTATLTPSLVDVGADASTQTLRLQIGSTCAWSASSDSGWVAVSPPTSGQGSATIQLAIAANGSTSSRSAIVMVAGRQSTIRQAAAPAPAPCTYSLGATSQNVGAGGGTGSFTVSTASGCAWTAAAAAPWVTITSGASGNGSGSVAFSVQANTGSTARSTTITAAGLSFTINQDAPAPPPCTYALSPGSVEIAAAGGQGQFTLTTQPGCAWTAMASVPWLSVGTASGTGSATVTYNVQANTDTMSRTGNITAGGQTHVVTQDAAAPPPPPPCTYSLDPTSGTVPAAGGQGQFQVTTQSGCTWTAATTASWITITNSAGTGTGNVTFTAQANPDTMPRSATISAGGQVYTVNQDAGSPAPPPMP